MPHALAMSLVSLAITAGTWIAVYVFVHFLFLFSKRKSLLRDKDVPPDVIKYLKKYYLNSYQPDGTLMGANCIIDDDDLNRPKYINVPYIADYGWSRWPMARYRIQDAGFVRRNTEAHRLIKAHHQNLLKKKGKLVKNTLADKLN